jgi:hypothetical protein
MLIFIPDIDIVELKPYLLCHAQHESKVPQESHVMIRISRGDSCPHDYLKVLKRVLFVAEMRYFCKITFLFQFYCVYLQKI